MAPLKLFSLEGKGLKFDSAADLEAHIADLRSTDVEEVKMLGNTFGVEACKLLGEVLSTKKNLQVCPHHAFFSSCRHAAQVCTSEVPR